MNDFLVYQEDGGVVTLTMNQPETRNALSGPEQMQALVDTCERINRDARVKAVILTGAGPAFCAGGNVKHMRDKEGIAAGSPFQIRNNYRNGIQRVPLALYNLEVPTIAAINGPAIGAGLDLACMCDIRIAARRAVFAESFAKLGIVPGDGGAWLLPRVVGMSKAAELSFTGDTIDASEALAAGLVSRVVDDAALLDAALEVARRIAANPSHSLRMTKRLLREGQHVRLDTLLEMSAAFQALAHHTQDHDEAVNAFLEKRQPQYHGL
ncbi:crotonase/enoyl-CoA hydratase family protein [Paraburkholderia aromaticivorans]|uniref:crotonase/enoyl-CoA hydratase family protein n=1 Tax=Paraburkholderia aromaticivorans TaxID=2026199 RepID=UPI001455EB07|nr:crotonase/enoyl-CoA hydratase family protein [Paraburkholderia aromaticivorans]